MKTYQAREFPCSEFPRESWAWVQRVGECIGVAVVERGAPRRSDTWFSPTDARALAAELVRLASEIEGTK